MANRCRSSHCRCEEATLSRLGFAGHNTAWVDRLAAGGRLHFFGPQWASRECSPHGPVLGLQPEAHALIRATSPPRFRTSASMSIQQAYGPGKFGLSFELFPPKTPAGEVELFRHLEPLMAFRPSYVTCTYGAGGSTRDKTLDIVTEVRRATACRSPRI